MRIAHCLSVLATLAVLVLSCLPHVVLSAESVPNLAAEAPPSFSLGLQSTDASVVLAPLGPEEVDELDALGRPPSGVTRLLTPQRMRELSAAPGPAWSQTVAGLVWRVQVESPDAKALRLHFSGFAVGEGGLWIHSKSTRTFGPYRGRGPFGDGDFWTPTLLGDAVVVEFWPSSSSLAKDGVPFQLVELGHLWQLPDGLAEFGLGEQLEDRVPDVAPWSTAAPSDWQLAGHEGGRGHRPLMGGVPKSFALAAPTGPTVMGASNSYVIEVGQGADSVEFALRAVDHDSAVALFIRYGSDVRVRDGRVLADHVLEGLDGRASAVLRNSSSPPLRPGQYFVSVGARQPGKFSTGTVTVTPRYFNHACFSDATCRTESDSALARQASAVAMIAIVDDETKQHGYCSGALLGGESGGSGPPNFLTAAHCVENDAEARTVEAFWHFQNRQCSGKPSNNLDSRYRSTSGARLLGVESGSLVSGGGIDSRGSGDMALLRLLESPPSTASRLAWNVQRNAIRTGTNVVGIHHAESQPKQISYGRIERRLQNMFFVEWGNGLTIGGASGSPLLNEAGQVLGVLSGGRDDHAGCFDQGSPTLYSSLATFYPEIRHHLDGSERPPGRPVQDLDVNAGGALQPGTPRQFWLGSGTARRLMNGTYSYLVDVPVGAAELELTLASRNPAVDVDLFVRYEADNQVTSFDWSATTPSGNERIVIRPTSTPPLRPGRYYVSLLLYDISGAPGSGTLAARLVAGRDSVAPQGDIEFVSVPPGEFVMGSLSFQSDPDETPLTRVRISQGFEMGKHEVSQGQWEAVMGTNPSENLSCGEQCPVERVSWNDAQEFIAKLNAVGDGYVYRLPTEAEWEYAVRAGTTGARYGPVERIAWHGGNSGGETKSAGLKASNRFGLYDMLGNVSEWVQDWYGPYAGGVVADPTGPASGTYRGLRGGSWNTGLKAVRSAFRDRAQPHSRNSDVGLRLVRTVVGDGGQPRSGRTLDVGVPQQFVLPPPTSGQLQNGRDSYVVVIPEGASTLTLTLDSADSRVDVDLFVRYERDNAHGVSDWSATTPSGDERLEIHRGSIPPLLPGRYFVSLLLYGDSAAGASGTLTATVTLTGNDAGPAGMEFVRVRSGRFVMGSDSGWAFPDETPLTSVRITRDFEIGKYEVTREQWEAVMGSRPPGFDACGPNCPAVGVSWEDVRGFLARLNSTEDGYEYRLPSEAEWEYAARAGSTADHYGPIDEVAWYAVNSGFSLHRVGLKAPNRFGLHDILGNVSEWVQNWYGPYPGSEVTDPTGPGFGFRRVTRGGSFTFDLRNTRVSARNSAYPYERFNSVGFRVLRTASDARSE